MAMDRYETSIGEGRTKVYLSADTLGNDFVVSIYNKVAHLGAVAIGEYDSKSKRTSTSVMTRLGHKDDVIAQKAAHLISKQTRQPSCVIVGVHINSITKEEIEQFLKNADLVVADFLTYLQKPRP